MINNRRSFRLRKQFDFTWSITEQTLEGKGKIFNLSLSGMLMVTDKLFKPEDGLIMNFSAPQISSFPSKGTLKWFRKVGEKESQYQCGVQFLKEAAQNPSWIKWLEENISKLGDALDSNIADRYLS